MQTALDLEKNVNQALLDLHALADSHGDFQVGLLHNHNNVLAYMSLFHFFMLQALYPSFLSTFQASIVPKDVILEKTVGSAGD